MILLTVTAIFWDGAHQLSGTLELNETKLIFRFDDFKHSHLNLSIMLSDIKYAKVFLVFNIARKGLKIETEDGTIDMFVLEDSKAFCIVLNNQIKKVSF